jgi:hypothetical protein
MDHKGLRILLMVHGFITFVVELLLVGVLPDHVSLLLGIPA